MRKCVIDVTEFHDTAKINRRFSPLLPGPEERLLRMRLLREEYQEYMQGEADGNIVDIADGLIDMIYIAVGTGLTYGFPMVALWNEVHRTNMAKFPNGVVRFRADGKIIKPEGWEPPNITAVLEVFKAQREK